MLEHLCSPSYVTYASSLNNAPPGHWQFDATAARKLYRELSNAVHGKLATFETKLQDRFGQSDADWKNHLNKVESVQDLLLGLASQRFQVVKAELTRLQPQLTGIHL